MPTKKKDIIGQNWLNAAIHTVRLGEFHSNIYDNHKIIIEFNDH